MSNDPNMCNFTSQMVIRRIKEEAAAKYILDILQNNPSYKLETAGQIDKKYGGSSANLYQFLSQVIDDGELYGAIDIPDEVREEAYRTQPTANQNNNTTSMFMQKDVEALKKQEQNRVASNRAHELLILANIMTQEVSLNLERQQEGA